MSITMMLAGEQLALAFRHATHTNLLFRLREKQSFPHLPLQYYHIFNKFTQLAQSDRDYYIFGQPSQIGIIEDVLAYLGLDYNIKSHPQSMHEEGLNILKSFMKNVRGLTDKQIDELGYKSTPSFFLCRKLTERLIEKGCMVQGVPGFYMKDGRWTIKFCTKMSGILIPVRGIDGLIYGMQIRLDVPIKDENDDPEKSGTKYIWLSSSNKPMGVSSGTPIHFIGDPYARNVYITEGFLKADISHCLTNRTFAATAGANNTSNLEQLFKILKQNGTETIIEAEDMDR